MEPVEQNIIEKTSMLLAMQTDIQVAGLSASGAVNIPEILVKTESTARQQYSIGETLVNKLKRGV